MVRLLYTVLSGVNMLTMLKIGRRYIRFFRWIDCLEKAYTVFREETGLVAVLAVGKWSCMGAFLFLESLTIVSYKSYFPS